LVHCIAQEVHEANCGVGGDIVIVKQSIFWRCSHDGEERHVGIPKLAFSVPHKTLYGVVTFWVCR